MPASPKLANQTHLLVRPWQDATIDAVGHDPRSYYVERFWLPILGPSVVLLLRRAAYAFDVHPEGTALDLDETARDLGLSYRGGSTSAFGRAVIRTVQFRMGRVLDEHTIELRRHLPHLTRRQLERLTDSARAEHDALMDARLGAMPRRPAPPVAPVPPSLMHTATAASVPPSAAQPPPRP